jgi:hypothetical protein
VAEEEVLVLRPVRPTCANAERATALIDAAADVKSKKSRRVSDMFILQFWDGSALTAVVTEQSDARGLGAVRRRRLLAVEERHSMRDRKLMPPRNPIYTLFLHDNQEPDLPAGARFSSRHRTTAMGGVEPRRERNCAGFTTNLLLTAALPPR